MLMVPIVVGTWYGEEFCPQEPKKIGRTISPHPRYRGGDQLSTGPSQRSELDDEQEPLLIDWRAPAAEPFYRATPAAPGEVVRRRHFQTQGRLVTAFHDDVLDLEALGDAERGRLNGEAALLASLAAPRTGRMR